MTSKVENNSQKGYQRQQRIQLYCLQKINQLNIFPETGSEAWIQTWSLRGMHPPKAVFLRLWMQPKLLNGSFELMIK